jgi:hypothetical protein
VSSSERVRAACLAFGAVAITLAGTVVLPAFALADPAAQPEVENPAPEQETLHNITYRVRVDGVSRGTTVTYHAEGDQTLTANPTMVPGRVFEANTVLPGSQIANLRVSVDWPYSANLHCEILVDDAIVSQADDFIAPRVLPQRDDPDYGAITCEAPVSGLANPVPADPAAPPPPEGPPPAEPAQLPPA